MPIGLQGAPATFQWEIGQVLTPPKKYATAYLDDIVIFSPDWESHLQKVQSLHKAVRKDAHEPRVRSNVQSSPVAALESKLPNYDDKTQVQPFKIRLKDTLDKYDHDIREKKRSKFFRDRKDFDTQQAFQWKHQGNRSRQRARRRTRRGLKHRPAASTVHQIWGPQDTETAQTLPQIEAPLESVSPSPVSQGPSGKLQVINLSEYKLTSVELSVLQRGLTFSPVHNIDKFTLVKDLYLFCRCLVLQVLHSRPQDRDGLDQTDQRVLQDLLQLLQEDAIESVTFLDLEVVMENDTIITKLYRKPTATNGLLDFRSFHPQHTRHGVPIGQFLRTRRNCTRDEDFKSEALALTSRFKERNYPQRCISSAFQRARSETQESLLNSTRKV
ncbi:uncharacterized protein [Ranitomeya imitator]|uniref:uncharacterized protein n=1 Tax=Ranitomeya imitator TaxID=111125 RepID=UPI0037E828FD